jgi:hypothetical protein
VTPFGNGAAGLANIAWADRRAAGAVRADAIQRLGDQARGGGFPDAANARHQKGVGEPVATDRVAERLHHRILADQLVEALRPIFAGEDAIGLRALRLGRLVQAEAEAVGIRGHGESAAGSSGSSRCVGEGCPLSSSLAYTAPQQSRRKLRNSTSRQHRISRGL